MLDTQACTDGVLQPKIATEKPNINATENRVQYIQIKVKEKF